MIVLAGGIGSGKSVVARILRLKGFGVFDCDLEAKRLMEADTALICKIKDICGEESYLNGRLNRKAVSSKIFNDEVLRKCVNSVVHEAVRNSVDSWCKKDPRNIFVETAIAAESGLASMADGVWLVTASPETRLARVKSRDGRSEEDILKIMSAQLQEEERLLKQPSQVTLIPNDPSDLILSNINLLCSYLPDID